LSNIESPAWFLTAIALSKMFIRKLQRLASPHCASRSYLGLLLCCPARINVPGLLVDTLSLTRPCDHVMREK